MTSHNRADDIRRFVRRDWDSAAASKARYWAERYRAEGWRPVWDAAQALLEHVKQVRPDFPTDRDRERDLADHATLRARLDGAAHALTRR